MGTARPCSCVARSRSASVAPASARTMRRSGSTSTPRISEWSITRPPSTVPYPATLWPPPRIATGSPASRAKARAATTSPVERGRTMSPGRRSCIAFQIARASS